MKSNPKQFSTFQRSQSTQMEWEAPSYVIQRKILAQPAYLTHNSEVPKSRGIWSLLNELALPDRNHEQILIQKEASKKIHHCVIWEKKGIYYGWYKLYSWSYLLLIISQEASIVLSCRWGVWDTKWLLQGHRETLAEWRKKPKSVWCNSLEQSCAVNI